MNIDRLQQAFLGRALMPQLLPASFWYTIAHRKSGEMSEWLKEHAWKVCMGS